MLRQVDKMDSTVESSYIMICQVCCLLLHLYLQCVCKVQACCGHFDPHSLGSELRGSLVGHHSETRGLGI